MDKECKHGLTPRPSARVFTHVSTLSQVEEVPGDFTQSDLATDDVMLLDTGDQVMLAPGGTQDPTEGGQRPPALVIPSTKQQSPSGCVTPLFLRSRAPRGRLCLCRCASDSGAKC